MSCLTPDSSPVLCAMGMFSGRYFGILSLFRSFLGLVWFSVGGMVMSLGVVELSRPRFLASKSIVFLWSIVF